MKYVTLLYLTLPFLFFSCNKKEEKVRTTACVQSAGYNYHDDHNKGSICTSDLCTHYLAIWKELIKEKNNLSQNYFDDHIELVQSGIGSWDQGISFSVCYEFKMGWAVAYNCDQFIIKINPENSYYPAVELPRDTYLDRDQIKRAVDNRAFYSHITKMTNTDKLKFVDRESALNDLIKFSGVNALCSGRIFLDEDTGDLTMEAAAQYANEENSCIQGIIDLISADKEVRDTPCYIN